MNFALLDKWLWRLGDGSEGLWWQLLLTKYVVQRDSWELKEALCKNSAFWKGILKLYGEHQVQSGFRGEDLFSGLTHGWAIHRWQCNS